MKINKEIISRYAYQFNNRPWIDGEHDLLMCRVVNSNLKETLNDYYIKKGSK